MYFYAELNTPYGMCHYEGMGKPVYLRLSDH